MTRLATILSAIIFAFLIGSVSTATPASAAAPAAQTMSMIDGLGTAGKASTGLFHEARVRYCQVRWRRGCRWQRCLVCRGGYCYYTGWRRTWCRF